jgi:hypothetical protein
MPAFAVQVDRATPTFLECRPFLRGSAEYLVTSTVRCPTRKVHGSDRTRGLLESDVVLLQNENARATLGELARSQQPDQPSTDDDDVTRVDCAPIGGRATRLSHSAATLLTQGYAANFGRRGRFSAVDSLSRFSLTSAASNILGTVPAMHG